MSQVQTNNMNERRGQAKTAGAWAARFQPLLPLPGHRSRAGQAKQSCLAPEHGNRPSPSLVYNTYPTCSTVFPWPPKTANLKATERPLPASSPAVLPLGLYVHEASPKELVQTQCLDPLEPAPPAHTICPSRQRKHHLLGASLSRSYPTSCPTANPGSFTFKDPVCGHFSSLPLPPPWSKPPSLLPWVLPLQLTSFSSTQWSF